MHTLDEMSEISVANMMRGYLDLQKVLHFTWFIGVGFTS